MVSLSESRTYAILKCVSKCNHYVQACTDVINDNLDDENVINSSLFEELLYNVIESLAEKYVCIRDSNLLGYEHIDFLRRVAGTKEECNTYPVIDSLDNYHDIVAKMYPEFDGKSCINITFQVTEDCNLKCTYCYQHNKAHRVLKFEDAKTLIDQILTEDPKVTKYVKCTDYKACVLDFIGGEPFLEIDLIEEITQYFVHRLIELNHPWLATYMISISSNGILYEDERVQNYIRKHNKIVSLSVTVDGTRELHDKCRVFPNGDPTYAIAHAASMDCKRKSGIDTSKITLAPDNIAYFADCILQMLSDGFNTIHANFVFEDGWTNEHARIYYDQVKQLTTTLADKKIYGFDCDLITRECTPIDPARTENWCGGTGSMLCLSPNGVIYPCVRYAPSSIGSDAAAFDIGNVIEGIGTSPTWKERINTLRSITRQSQSSDECLNCPVADGCGWCSAYNYECFGTANKRATYICCMHKARALASVFYNNTNYILGNSGKIYNVLLPASECIKIIGEDNYRELADLTLSIGGSVCGL